jgi:hypothetical protein
VPGHLLCKLKEGEKKMNLCDPKTAIAAIRPGHRVFVHGGAATPHLLLDTLLAEKEKLLKKVEEMKTAVKLAREEANSIEVTKSDVGDKVLGYIFE